MTRNTEELKETMMEQFRQALREDKDFLRPLIQTVMRELLEEEMNATVGARKGERTATRLGYRSGYYPRTLVTRVGKIELMAPQDREGRFCTILFERYQRGEKTLVTALIVPRNEVTTCEQERSQCISRASPRARWASWQNLSTSRASPGRSASTTPGRSRLVRGLRGEGAIRV